jgi:hypothetical protein
MVSPVAIIIETDLPGAEDLPIYSVTYHLNDYWVVGHLKLLRQSERVYIFPGEGAVLVFAELTDVPQALTVPLQGNLTN